MKVNIKNTNNQKEFGDLADGTTFYINKGSGIYIKAFGSKVGAIAVRLNDGFVDTEIDDFDDVIVVDAEVNITNNPF